MVLIDNEQQLKALLLLEIQKAMKVASGRIAKELWLNVFSRISILPETAFYDRTGQFLESVIKNPQVEIKGNSISVELGMDSSKMTGKEGGAGQFNQHMGFAPYTENWKGTSIPEALLGWWDTGTNNSYYPSLQKTQYWYDVMGDYAFTETGVNKDPNYDKFEQTFKQLFSSELKKVGMVIEM